jgi:hypothetical protein
VTRRDWTDIALALAALRVQLAEHAARSQRTTHLARREGVLLAARTICRILRQGSRRFDGKRFMRIVTTAK